MSDDLFGAPAGWYPDPLGLPQLRWWNNHAWTEQTSAARQPMVVQDTKFAWADDELPTRREERERERSGADRTPDATTVPTAESLRELEPPRAFTQVSQGVPSAPVVDTPPAPAAPAAPAAAAAPPAPPAAPAAPAATAAPAASVEPEAFFTSDPIPETLFPTVTPTAMPAFDRIFDAKPAAAAPEEALDALFGAKATRRTNTRIKTPIYSADQMPATMTGGAKLPSATGPAWAIAMIPLFQLVVSLLLLTSLGMGTSYLVFVAILVVPYFAAIGLAYLDNKALSNAGYEHPAAWGWAFLGAPVYLIVRARTVIRETGHGIGPVLVWLGLGVMHLASFVAIPGLIIALLPAVFSAQIEQSVADDAMLISTTQLTLSCPDTPPVLQGEQIVCPAVSGSGNHFDITVTLERSNGWIDWTVLDWGVFKK